MGNPVYSNYVFERIHFLTDRHCKTGLQVITDSERKADKKKTLPVWAPSWI